MMLMPPGVKVHVALGYTDKRNGLDGLAMLVQRVLAQDPFSGHMFVFRGRPDFRDRRFGPTVQCGLRAAPRVAHSKSGLSLPQTVARQMRFHSDETPIGATSTIKGVLLLLADIKNYS